MSQSYKGAQSRAFKAFLLASVSPQALVSSFPDGIPVAPDRSYRIEGKSLVETEQATNKGL